MAEKIGNGGSGLEKYDPKTGKYIKSEKDEFGIDLGVDTSKYSFLFHKNTTAVNTPVKKDVSVSEYLPELDNTEKRESLLFSDLYFDKEKIKGLSEAEIINLSERASIIGEINDLTFEINWGGLSTDKSKELIYKRVKLEDQKEEAIKYLEPYLDKNNVYGKYRKDRAVWIKNDEVLEALRLSEERFQERANKVWESLNDDEKTSVRGYTESDYQWINKSLRTGSDKTLSDKRKKRIEDLTNVIDKSSYNEDIWIQRGIQQYSNFINGKSVMDFEKKDDFKKLKGVIFQDKGFFSAGAAKGTGFSSQGVILNTYCPKGTKMLYARKYSPYNSENEFILQRGYSYRITKAERKGDKVYIDCEVLLK